MDIYYLNNTLFVDVSDALSGNEMTKLKRRIGDTINDYNVEKIVFEGLNNVYSSRLLLIELKNSYSGKVLIR